jgi:anti-sigma B factor antagonist
MEVHIEQVEQIPVITVSGRLDTRTAPLFDAEVQPLLATPRRRLLADVGGLTYISSAGLRSLLHLVKHTAAQQGRVGLVAVQPQILETIEISGFIGMLDVYPDRASALEASR